MAAGSAVLGAVMLASIGIADVSDPSPRDLIQDPEVVVAEERLGEVRDDYIADASLGIEAYKRANFTPAPLPPVPEKHLAKALN